MKPLVDTLGEGLPNAWDGLEIGQAGVFNPLPSTKVAKEGLHFLGSKPLHGFERVFQGAASPSFPMESVNEAMGFVAGMDKDTPMPVEHHWVVALSKHGFLALGQCGDLKSAPNFCFLQRPSNGVEVGLTPVEQQQIGPFVLPL